MFLTFGYSLVLTPKKLVVLKMESFFVYKQILVKQDANMSHDIPPCQHKHEITWLSCNQAWRIIKEKQSHVATPRCHVFDSHVPIREWQHGKKLCDIRHNVLEGFLESKCVYFLFLFSVLFCLFFCLYLCLFFFFFPFFLGRDSGRYSHSFINLWNLGCGDITEPIFRPM